MPWENLTVDLDTQTMQNIFFCNAVIFGENVDTAYNLQGTWAP